LSAPWPLRDLAIAAWGMPVGMAYNATLYGAAFGCSHRVDRGHGHLDLQT
jgi:hypothetical protein